MEKRRYLTPARKQEVRERYQNKCGCGCGESLPESDKGVHYDHVLPLWLGGSNDIDNFAPVLEDHHLKKTVRETKQRAKIKRIQKRERGEKKKGRPIPSPGFQGWRDMAGNVRWRKEKK